MNSKKAKKLRKLVYKNDKIDRKLKREIENKENTIDVRYVANAKRKTYKNIKKIYNKAVMMNLNNIKIISNELVVFFGDIIFISSMIAVLISAILIVLKHILENDYDFVLPKILYVLFNFILALIISIIVVYSLPGLYQITSLFFYVALISLCSFLIEFLFYLTIVKSFIHIKDIITNFFKLKKILSDVSIIRAKKEMQEIINNLQDEIAEYEAKKKEN